MKETGTFPTVGKTDAAGVSDLVVEAALYDRGNHGRLQPGIVAELVLGFHRKFHRAAGAEGNVQELRQRAQLLADLPVGRRDLRALPARIIQLAQLLERVLAQLAAAVGGPAKRRVVVANDHAVRAQVDIALEAVGVVGQALQIGGAGVLGVGRGGTAVRKNTWHGTTLARRHEPWVNNARRRVLARAGGRQCRMGPCLPSPPWAAARPPTKNGVPRCGA